MNNLLDFLNNQYVLKGLLVGLLAGINLALLGTFTVLRNQSSLANGVSHASLAGIAFGLLVGYSPIYFAIIVGVVMAIFITYADNKSLFRNDAAINLLYVIFFALGIVIIRMIDGYTPEVSSYLFGSILLVDRLSIILNFVMLVVSVLFIVKNYKKLIYMTYDKDGAQVRGVKTEKLNYLMNILLAIAVVLSVEAIGIVLVSALMVIPVVTAQLFANSFKDLINNSIYTIIFGIFTGSYISYTFDIPMGATIVLFLGGFYLASLSIVNLKRLF